MIVIDICIVVAAISTVSGVAATWWYGRWRNARQRDTPLTPVEAEVETARIWAEVEKVSIRAQQSKWVSIAFVAAMPLTALALAVAD